MVLGGDVPSVGPQEELRGPSVYFQGFYFEPTTGGEVRIFGFYTIKNKQANKTNKLKGPGQFLGSWDFNFLLRLKVLSPSAWSSN